MLSLRNVLQIQVNENNVALCNPSYFISVSTSSVKVILFINVLKLYQWNNYVHITKYKNTKTNNMLSLFSHDFPIQSFHPMLLTDCSNVVCVDTGKNNENIGNS